MSFMEGLSFARYQRQRASLPRVPIAGADSFGYSRDGVAGLAALRLEMDLVADLDLPEHGGVLDAVDHRHRLVHAKTLGRTVLERDLAGALVDLLDLAVDGRARSQRDSGAQRQREQAG